MKKGLTVFQLKCIAIILMIGGIGIQRIVYELTIGRGLSPTAQQEVLSLIGFWTYLAAFPLAAFLLVEAAKHTSDRKKLLLRLLIAAVVAEIPMDIATFGPDKWKSWGNTQNYFFTMGIGLCVIMLAEKVAKKYPSGGMSNTLITLVIYIVAVMVAGLLKTEQGSIGILTIVALYLFYGSKKLSIFSVLVLYLLFGSGGLECISVLSLIFTWMYVGNEGKKTKWTRVFFYAAYPMAYCIVSAVARLL